MVWVAKDTLQSVVAVWNHSDASYHSYEPTVGRNDGLDEDRNQVPVLQKDSNDIQATSSPSYTVDHSHAVTSISAYLQHK